MRPDPIITVATPADAPSLATLAAQTWLHTYATRGIRPTIARYVQEQLTPDAFAHQLRRPETVVLVAQEDGHLVGYSILELNAPCGFGSTATTHLDKLFVQEHFLGRGIGHALLARSRLESQHRAGSAALWLTVNSQNKKAQVFYDRQGFRNIGMTHFDLYGEQHENLVLHAL